MNEIDLSPFEVSHANFIHSNKLSFKPMRDNLIYRVGRYRPLITNFSSTGPDVNPQKVLMMASRNIRSKYNFFEMTLQIEQFDDNMVDCTQCKMPEK